MKRTAFRLLGALAVSAVLDLQTPTALAQSTAFPVVAITNPTPAFLDYFGDSVAAVGTDRVLIGAYGRQHLVGAAYLFSTNGVSLTVFTNPAPSVGDRFGWAVAAVGGDFVLIGAYGDSTGATGSGAAYLFSTKGALITTFTNPTPATYDGFGSSVVAVGTDRVLIGAPVDDAGVAGSGAAYLFSTNGALLRTLINPAPSGNARFGQSIAAMGLDRLLIGTPQANDFVAGSIVHAAGFAYLFSTNGALLRTFANPTPEDYDYFGRSVAAVGADRVLIGAYGDAHAGAAYLFSTNGALLRTFANPTPANWDHFGCSVAAVGTDRVLVGASRANMAAYDAGAAYVFSTNGALLGIFTKPTPAASDGFGMSLTAVGADWVVIGAPNDNTGLTDAGAAYLFSSATSFTAVTITNPTPAVGDLFGHSVAPMGDHRVLVGAIYDDTGATNAGAVSLFSTNGTLLFTFTNPTPSLGDLFGYSVAGVGADQVLVGATGDDTGAENAGAAYLFGADGVMLTTFTNPTPTDGGNFGWSVAAVGSERLLIGARYGDPGAMGDGAAYLFSAYGALLTTFTNPTPTDGGSFGCSVAAVGSERVLIGARFARTGAAAVGAAYLFSTNGTLFTTFTNPTSAATEYFGWSVAAMGSERVLIGSPLARAGALPVGVGAAYLFSINGALLTTFTNPTPAALDRFGASVAVVGTDRVLIGSPDDDLGATNAGTAYLFSTNGTLLRTFSNPMPAYGAYFGWSVTEVGADRLLIGATHGARDTGVAYLFSLSEQMPVAPSLTIHLTPTNTVAVLWPSPSTGWTLQQNTNGLASVNWSNAPGPIQDDGMTKTLIVTPSAENRFYRLSKP